MSGFTQFKIETTDKRVNAYQPIRNVQHQQYITGAQLRPEDYRVQTNPIMQEQITINDQASFQKIIIAKDSEIANLRQSVDSLNKQISDYINEIDQWKNKYKQLQVEKGTNRITNIHQGNDFEINQYKDEINKLKQENKQLEEQIKKTVYVSYSPNYEINELRDQIKQLTLEKEDLIILKNLQTQKFQTSQIQNQQNTIKQSIVLDLDQFKNERDEYKRKIQLLEDKIQDQQQEIQSLNFNCDQYIQEIQQSSLRSINKNQNVEIENYIKRISALQNEILVWQNRYKATQTQEQGYSIEQKVSQKDNQIIYLQERIRQFELQVEQLKLEAEKSKKELNGYRISCDNKKCDTQEVDALKRKIAEMEQDIQILIQDLNERDQRISSTQNEYQEFRNQNKTQYQQELNQLRQERDKYQQDYERLSNELMIMQRQSDQYNKNNNLELDQLRQRIIELEQQLRNSNYQYQLLQNSNSNLSAQLQNQQQSQQSQYQQQSLKEEYKNLQNQYMQIQSEIYTYKELIKKYQNDQEMLYQENLQLKQQKSQIEKNTYQFTNQQNEYQTIQDRCSWQQNEIQQLNEQIRKYRNDYESLNQNYILLERESEIKYSQQNSKELEVLKQRINQYEQRVFQYESQIQQLRMQIQNQESQFEQSYKERLKVELSFAEQKFNQQGRFELQSLQQQYKSLQNQYDQLLVQYQESNIELRQVNQFESQNLRDELQSLRQINLQYSQEITNLKEQNLKYKNEYEQINQRIILIQRESESFKSSSIELDKLSSKLKELDYELQAKNQENNQLQLELRNLDMQVRDELEQQFISRLTVERQNLENRLIQQNKQELKQLSFQLQQSQIELNQQISKYQKLEQQYNLTKIEITQIRSQQSNINIEQLKRLQITNTEYEQDIQTLKIEIERQKNIKQEQENKIQVLITSVTDYESRLHILEQENARLENKIKRQIFTEKQNDQMIVNQLVGQQISGINKSNLQVVAKQSGINQVSQIPSSYNQYTDWFQNDVKSSQFSQKILNPQTQISKYLSPDKNYQTQRVVTTKSVKQAIMSSANQG
ncbi:unnamed protein product [Paramecium sonneborni]|uniref:Uncharacterized protein n=1 Tax=Paramecium sonneborni TaxID=65129 RepID=A0A8S1RP54_9CILI|nr:unnamed protein product [Paramecium sonneborni]